MLKGFAAGIVATALAGAAAAYIFMFAGFMPVNADSTPPNLEKWAAHKALHAVIAREAQHSTGPLGVNEENATAGLRLYAANCAICHGAADGEPSNVAKGLYQRPPQLAKHGVTDDPEGEIHWKIKHGIRLTGMPAYSPSLNDNEIWQLTQFLKHLKTLPLKTETLWKALPSVAAPAEAAKPAQAGPKK